MLPILPMLPASALGLLAALTLTHTVTTPRRATLSISGQQTAQLSVYYSATDRAIRPTIQRAFDKDPALGSALLEELAISGITVEIDGITIPWRWERRDAGDAPAPWLAMRGTGDVPIWCGVHEIRWRDRRGDKRLERVWPDGLITEGAADTERTIFLCGL